MLKRTRVPSPGVETSARDPPTDLDTLAHSAYAESAVNLVGGEPDTVVVNLDFDAGGMKQHGDRRPVRASVLGDIGQRLLDQPVDGDVDFWTEGAADPDSSLGMPRASSSSTPVVLATRSASASIAASSPSSSSVAGRSSVIRLRRPSISSSICEIADCTDSVKDVGEPRFNAVASGGAAPRGPAGFHREAPAPIVHARARMHRCSRASDPRQRLGRSRPPSRHSRRRPS